MERKIIKNFEDENENGVFYTESGNSFHYESERGSWILTGQGREDMEFESEKELLDYVKEHNL